MNSHKSRRGRLVMSIFIFAVTLFLCRNIMAQDWALTVESSPSSGIAITGTHPGVTTYTTSVSEETPITLTAPEVAGGLNFVQWSNQAGELLSTSPTLTFSITGLEASPSPLYAGTAKVDITPDQAVITAGGTSWRLPDELPTEPTPPDNVHDPLYARVVVLKNDDVSLAIVSLDLCLFSSKKVIDEAKAQWGVDFVVLSSTHTHSGMVPREMVPTVGGWDWTYAPVDPGESLDWPGFSEDPWYAATEAKVIAAIGEAMGNLFPARIASGHGPYESWYMAHNRRLVNSDGSVTMLWSNPDRIPTEPLDPTMRVIRVDDATGNPRALMVNYACHAVCLMGSDWISADFPGAMVDYIEGELGEDCMGMFLQGGEGDIDPYEISLRDEYGSDYVEQAGADLGQAAIDLAATLPSPEESNAVIEIQESMLDIAYRTGSGSTQACIMTAVINDDLALVMMPGEIFVQHQLNLRDRSPIAKTLMLGIAYSGQGSPFLIYVPTAQAVTEGGYGAGTCSYVEPDAGENMVNKALVSIKAAVGQMTVVAEYAAPTIENALYVNDDVVGEAGSLCTAAGNDANDGLTPDSPMRNIQVLLDTHPDLGAGDTVWVDPGTYVENITLGTTHAGLRLQGAGQEVTIVDGNHAGTCVTLNEFTDSTISGFTFRNGSAYDGAGMYVVGCSPTVSDCTFSNNSATELGGGLYNTSGASSTVTNCTFIGNSARTAGGMMNYGCSPTITNCTFSDNTASSTSGGGGGMLNHYSWPTITNCIFTNNSAGWGGGMFNEGYAATLTNCTFTTNSANNHGGGMCNYNASPTLTNCILWANTATNGPQIGYYAEAASGPNTVTVGYSNVQGGEANVFRSPEDVLNWELGNIDADPLFVSATDVHLQANSPCIDSANGVAAPELDFEGWPRCDDTTMPNVGNGPPWADMGACEFQATATGRKGDFDLDDDVDFWDFMEFIDCYGMTDADPGWSPNGPTGDFDDNGNVNFWDFMEFIDVYGT